MINTPLMTHKLARKIERVDIDYTVSRLGGMQAAKGNPLGIEIRRYGQTVAFLIKAWPRFWYGQKVAGLNPSDVEHLDDIVNLYRKHNLSFRFKIIPGNLNKELAARLSNLGFHQVGFSAVLYGPAQLLPEKPPVGVSVRKIDPDELELFLNLL